MEIRDLRSLDWPEVAAIYEDGIRTGNATFETGVPSWEDWDAAHTDLRLLAELDGRTAGWAALSTYSDRCCYSGVAEDSVYVASWAQGQGIDDASIPALAQNPKVLELIQAELDRSNAHYAQVEQVKKFFVLDHDLSQETGELTPTLKVKRNIVNDKYADRFEALYGGSGG